MPLKPPSLVPKPVEVTDALGRRIKFSIVSPEEKSVSSSMKLPDELFDVLDGVSAKTAGLNETRERITDALKRYGYNGVWTHQDRFGNTFHRYNFIILKKGEKSEPGPVSLVLKKALESHESNLNELHDLREVVRAYLVNPKARLLRLELNGFGAGYNRAYLLNHYQASDVSSALRRHSEGIGSYAFLEDVRALKAKIDEQSKTGSFKGKQRTLRDKISHFLNEF